jgi:hypothetical protein
MSRGRGVRSLIVEQLRHLGANARTMTAQWGSPPSRTFYDANDGRGFTSHFPGRARKDIPAEEYPENNPEQLRRLIRFMITIEEQAAEAHRLAAAQLQILESK